VLADHGPSPGQDAELVEALVVELVPDGGRAGEPREEGAANDGRGDEPEAATDDAGAASSSIPNGNTATPPREAEIVATPRIVAIPRPRSHRGRGGWRMSKSPAPERAPRFK
jgi:hypothetical protein